MASLTGKTISSTYDGLLKTTDNDVLNATAKEITDGLGNGSGVALDTGGNVTISGDFQAQGGIKDSSGDLGTSGQILSSTGTGTNWADAGGAVDSVNAGTGISVDVTTGNVTVTNSEPNYNHTGEVTGATALTITSGAVTNAKMAANSVDSDQYVDGSIDTVHLSDDSIAYDKLAAEFTTSAPIAASDVDFSTAQVFTKTLTGATTLTYSNAEIGMVKDLIINADGNSFILPTGTKIIAGTPTTGINLIQVVVTAAGEYWTSISQEQ